MGRIIAAIRKARKNDEKAKQQQTTHTGEPHALTPSREIEPRSPSSDAGDFFSSNDRRQLSAKRDLQHTFSPKNSLTPQGATAGPSCVCCASHACRSAINSNTISRPPHFPSHPAFQFMALRNHVRPQTSAVPFQDRLKLRSQRLRTLTSVTTIHRVTHSLERMIGL